MECLYNKPINGVLEIVGGKYVFKSKLIEVTFNMADNLPCVEKIANLDIDEIVTVMLVNKNICLLSKIPNITLGSMFIINYEFAIFNKEFVAEDDYLKHNVKIEPIKNQIDGNLYITDNGVHLYQVKRLDNDRESLTYTKFVDMKLKDLDNIDSTSLLFYLQRKHNRSFMYYLD